MSFAKKLVAGSLVVGTLAAAGVVGAAVQRGVWTFGDDRAAVDRAQLACPGGMTRLGHPFDENMSVFPFDPAVHVDVVYNVADDFFRVEDIDMGAHAGTHIDVPAHFLDQLTEGARALDDMLADEFVWPAYKIDVRDMELTNGQVEIADIRAYEQANGRIDKGSLVVLQTGAEEFFGLGGDGDTRAGEDGLAMNVDDLFSFDNAGFSAAAVQWLFDRRKIDGVGSDAYGPDAARDEFFLATYTTLANDGVALVAIANLDSVAVKGDIIMAPAVNLTDGSGFPVDPLACHARR